MRVSLTKPFRFASFMLFLAGVSTTSAVAKNAPLLTLEEALSIVRSQNLDVKNADIQIKVLGDQTDAARTKRYPELTAGVIGYQNFIDNEYSFAQGSLGTVGGSPVPSSNVEIETTDGFSTRYSLTAKQPLMALYEINLNVEKLEMQQNIARQQLRETRQSVSLQVKQLYYQILGSESAIESTESSISFYEELTKILKDKVEQKTELEYQLLNAEAELASAQHDLISQKNDIITNKQQLNSLLDRDIDTPFSVSLAYADPMLRYDPITAEEQALANRPETQEAILQVKVAEKDVDIQKTDYLPSVDLVASYSKEQRTTFIPDESMYVGVVAKWEFFTWGSMFNSSHSALKNAV
jgi:outer membrane protein TolC